MDREHNPWSWQDVPTFVVDVVTHAVQGLPVFGILLAVWPQFPAPGNLFIPL